MPQEPDPQRAPEQTIHEASMPQGAYQDCRRCGAPLESSIFAPMRAGTLVLIGLRQRTLFEVFPGAPYQYCRTEGITELPIFPG